MNAKELRAAGARNMEQHLARVQIVSVRQVLETIDAALPWLMKEHRQDYAALRAHIEENASSPEEEVLSALRDHLVGGLEGSGEQSRIWPVVVRAAKARLGGDTRVGVEYASNRVALNALRSQFECEHFAWDVHVMPPEAAAEFLAAAGDQTRNILVDGQAADDWMESRPALTNGLRR